MWKEYLEKISGLVGQSRFGLRSGASTENLLECEKNIKIDIPDDLKNIYQQNDGQEVDNLPIFPEAHEFLPLSEVRLVWNQLNEARSSEDGFLWEPCWIPFAQTIGGGYFCYVVSKSGNKIVQFYPESDKVCVYTDSIDNFIESLVFVIDNKKLIFDKNNNSFSFN